MTNLKTERERLELSNLVLETNTLTFKLSFQKKPKKNRVGFIVYQILKNEM
jgi:hypothetical protein